MLRPVAGQLILCEFGQNRFCNRIGFTAGQEVRQILVGADYTTAAREIFGTTDQRADTVTKTCRSYAARFEIRF